MSMALGKKHLRVLFINFLHILTFAFCSRFAPKIILVPSKLLIIHKCSLNSFLKKIVSKISKLFFKFWRKATKFVANLRHLFLLEIIRFSLESVLYSKVKRLLFYLRKTIRSLQYFFQLQQCKFARYLLSKRSWRCDQMAKIIVQYLAICKH